MFMLITTARVYWLVGMGLFSDSGIPILMYENKSIYVHIFNNMSLLTILFSMDVFHDSREKGCEQ